MTILGNDVAALFGKLESVLNLLTFAVVVQDFVGVDELCVLLKESDAW